MHEFCKPYRVIRYAGRDLDDLMDWKEIILGPVLLVLLPSPAQFLEIFGLCAVAGKLYWTSALPVPCHRSLSPT